MNWVRFKFVLISVKMEYFFSVHENRILLYFSLNQCKCIAEPKIDTLDYIGILLKIENSMKYSNYSLPGLNGPGQ